MPKKSAVPHVTHGSALACQTGKTGVVNVTDIAVPL
jgi:hypothetical protein